MDNLRHTLMNMQQLLEELRAILLDELAQLQSPQVNPVSLQRLSDNKSRLLSALNFYDEQRKLTESALHISAPYRQQPPLTPHWEKIAAAVRLTKEINDRIYPLIELQMKKAATLNNLVAKAGAGASLYCADGRTLNTLKGKAYNINI